MIASSMPYLCADPPLTARDLTGLGARLGGTALGIGLGLELLAFLWIRHLLEVR